MTRHGQGAFEYILMLAGVILIVVLIILIMQGSIFATNNVLKNNEDAYGGAVSIDFVNHQTPNLYVTENTGGVTNAPCCANQVGSATCHGPDKTSTSTACTPAKLNCQSKIFNNGSGTCG